MTVESTAPKQRPRGRPFKPGESGNAAGRPVGSRNRASLLAEAVSAADAVAIVRAVVARAKRGNVVAARVLLDRLWPAPRGRAVSFDIPPATDARGVIQAHAALLRSVSDAELTPDEAQAVSSILATHLRGIETADIERRLQALEDRQPDESGK